MQVADGYGQRKGADERIIQGVAVTKGHGSYWQAMQATSHSKQAYTPSFMQHTKKGSADIIATGASVAAGVPVCWMAMAASCMWLHVLAPSCNNAPAPNRPHTHARTLALPIHRSSSLIDLSILATKSVYIDQLAP